MALHKLVRKNYGGKSPVSIKYQDLHSFKERMILSCQCILETRRISHLHGVALFTIPLKERSYNDFPQINVSFKFYQINHRPLAVTWMVATSVVEKTQCA